MDFNESLDPDKWICKWYIKRPFKFGIERTSNLQLRNIHSVAQRSLWIIKEEATNRKIIHHIIKHDKKLLNWSLKWAI